MTGPVWALIAMVAVLAAVVDESRAVSKVLYVVGGDDPIDRSAADLDVHGEINKLASNIGMGRIFAGVHFRTDHIYGMLLGEQIAVATLYDHYTSNVTASSDGELTFTTLIGGEERTISPETFTELRQAALDREGLRP
jgi:hypothetical protein